MVFKWYKWAKERKTWTQAKENCEHLVGELFYDLDGTEEQLDFFSQKLDMQFQWLGLTSEDNVDWRNLHGETVPASLLKWNPGQPNTLSQIYLANIPYLEDMDEFHMFYSLCDMNPWTTRRARTTRMNSSSISLHLFFWPIRGFD